MEDTISDAGKSRKLGEVSPSASASDLAANVEGAYKNYPGSEGDVNYKIHKEFPKPDPGPQTRPRPG